jgi:hypothetical protein
MLAPAVFRSALATRPDLLGCLRKPPDAVRTGHASRPFLLRDVPLPASDVVARPDAPLRPAALLGFDPSQCCSCPRGFGSFPIGLTHLPFSERRPDDFVGGSAVHSHGSDLCHPLCLSDSQSRTFAAASGFQPCGQSVPVRFPWTEPAVTAVGFASFRCSAHRVWRCPRGLEDRSGHQPPEIRFRLLSALELGLVTRFEMRLNGQAVTHPSESLTGPTAY